MHRPGTSIERGSIWRKAALGSEALYEVVADHGDHVEVVVRQAPGLAAGTRVRLAPDAVRAMQRVRPEEVRQSHGDRPPQSLEGPQPAGA